MKKLLSMLLVALLAVSMMTASALAENRIITAIADNPEEMNPTMNSYARSSRVLQNLFKGLYKLDADGMTYVPAMAEDCEISEDGLTYTFKLREGLKWSDGSPLTAADFEYSWKRVINPETGSKAVSDLWVIKNAQAVYDGTATMDDVGITAVDDTTLVVELQSATPWFLKLTATTSYMPISKANAEANPDWTANVSTYVSNGPFMLTEYSSLNRLVMKKNPNYYLADEVKIDEVQFSIIPDAATELTAYNNGEINVTSNLNADALNQYTGTDEFKIKGAVGIQYCDFNTKLPEFGDKRVRQAFAMAIDRDKLLTALGIVEPAVYGFVPYAQPSLTDPSKSYRDVAGDMFTEDVEAAKALMAEAGYPNGEGFPVVEIVTKNDTQQKLLAQILGEFWKQNLGVEYSITTYESSVYWGELDAGNFSVDRNGFTCDYDDPSANLKIFITGSNAYENGWDDPVYDEMYEASLSITDPAEREQALIELEKYLVDQMPAMPVYSYNTQYLVKPEISGVVANAIGHLFFEYATVAE
ncbi:MAG: peptide ABC transporter substrate-binding protein [Christensenellales bacterium]|nr:peptide ABC transporter substrate-binding protein [Christensenellales bacterium]